MNIYIRISLNFVEVVNFCRGIYLIYIYVSYKWKKKEDK